MEYDFAVIGGGSAGYAGARTAAGLGLRTAVIEGGREIGGLCILRGCMPSKTLLESAHRFRVLKRAGEFGLSCGTPEFNASAIVARKKRLIAEFATYRREQLESG
ncbi:MAG: FAD-dependent oxidoreductase, partial [Spartobacteria bacterium]